MFGRNQNQTANETPKGKRAYFVGVDIRHGGTFGSSVERSNNVADMKNEFGHEEIEPKIGVVDTGIFTYAYTVETSEPLDDNFRKTIIKDLADATVKTGRKYFPNREVKVSIELDPNPERGAPRFHVG